PGMSEAEVDARVRATGQERVAEQVARGQTVVLALGHAGNWDLAGAWGNRHIGTVVTVAERLEPEPLFTRFTTFRESLGMVIIPFDRGGVAFRELLRQSRRPGIVPLLADRALSSTGVDVQVGEHELRVGTVAFEGGVVAFRELLRETRRPGNVPLLADRDLSSTGADVQVGEHEVRVAPGPAALALARGASLVPLLIHYERLHGARRRAA